MWRKEGVINLGGKKVVEGKVFEERMKDWGLRGLWGVIGRGGGRVGRIFRFDLGTRRFYGLVR